MCCRGMHAIHAKWLPEGGLPVSVPQLGVKRHYCTVHLLPVNTCVHIVCLCPIHGGLVHTLWVSTYSRDSPSACSCV